MICRISISTYIWHLIIHIYMVHLVKSSVRANRSVKRDHLNGQLEPLSSHSYPFLIKHTGN